jgi:(p)ppGpp synthase/HD superfamily hydrolase
LPAGATVVDFAYRVHTDVGNRCMAARIDRKLSGPRTRLESGQTVKIVTNPNANPSPSWLDFVITGKARSSIRHYLKNQRRSDATALGERMLAKELNNLDNCLDDIEQDHIDQVIRENHLDDIESLYTEMGLSTIPARNIAHRLLSISSRESLTPSEHDAGLWIRGTEGEIVTFAKCCNPIPGDPIVGHVNTGKGMVVHSEHCHNVQDFRNKPDKVAFLVWEKGINRRFSVLLTLSSENRVSLMADIATATLKSDARLESMKVEDSSSSLVTTTISLGVEGRKHLATTMKRLRAIPGMLRINRIRDGKEAQKA